MKKVLVAVLLSLIFANIGTPSFAAYSIPKLSWGKDPLKLSKHTADYIEYYFSNGRKGRYAKKQKTRWVPMFLVMSANGTSMRYYANPNPSRQYDMAPNYVGRAKSKCKKKVDKNVLYLQKRLYNCMAKWN